jgi:predicted nucleic acid-binding protein
MTQVVLDASVALAWFLDRPIPPLAVRVRQALASGVRGLIPPLWHLEMANGLALAQRRGFLTSAEIEVSLGQLESLLVSEALETDLQPVSVRDIFGFAATYSLTAYDSAYLELSQRKQLPLATLDQSLRVATSSAGLELYR